MMEAMTTPGNPGSTAGVKQTESDLTVAGHDNPVTRAPRRMGGAL